MIFFYTVHVYMSIVACPNLQVIFFEDTNSNSEFQTDNTGLNPIKKIRVLRNFLTKI